MARAQAVAKRQPKQSNEKAEKIPSIVPKKIRYESLKEIQPKTKSQEKFFDLYQEGYNLLLHGSAGTGKTWISIAAALEEILSGETLFKKLVIVRSCVPVRDLGALPGDLGEKIEVYELPYKAIFDELIQKNCTPNIEKLRDQGLYEFVSTSYIRGVTLKDCIIVVDEAENLTFHEADSIITRCGENCKILFCGDFKQTDLQKQSDINGFKEFCKILDRMGSFRHIEFYPDDIVRSGLVKEYILAKET